MAIDGARFVKRRGDRRLAASGDLVGAERHAGRKCDGSVRCRGDFKLADVGRGHRQAVGGRCFAKGVQHRLDCDVVFLGRRRRQI